MKKLSIKILFLFFWSLPFALSAQTDQMKKWYINQFEVDFSGSTPAISSLPLTYPIATGTSSSLEFAENSQGYYDSDGSILFYTAVENLGSGYLAYRVVDGSGTILGTLDKTPQNSAEMTMVPFGCADPNKFMLIYAIHESGGRKAPFYSRLVYTIIDLANHTVSPTFRVPNLGVNFLKAHAVSKLNPDGTRYLYTNEGEHIYKFIIDFTQPLPSLVSPDGSYPIVYTMPAGYYISGSELELSPTGQFLGWTNYRNAPYAAGFTVINLDAIGNAGGLVRSIDLPTASGRTVGLEFATMAMLQDVFVSYSNNGTNSNTEGIYRYSVYFNSLNLLPNTQHLKKSHIERAYDGGLYAATANQLFRFEGGFTTSVTIPTNTYFTYNRSSLNNYNDPDHSGGFYRLPDQIDGEEYSTDYNLPDLSNLVGAVCKNEAILHFPPSITNYTVTVEKPFEEPCTYEGSTRRLDLSNICGIECGDACNNSVRITIQGPVCGGEELYAQSNIFHLLCGPKDPVVQAPSSLCPGKTGVATVQNNYPSGTIIEWIAGGQVFATGPSATIGGSFTVRVTDAQGCITEKSFLVALLPPDRCGLTEEEVSLQIFPNPAQEEVEIEVLDPSIQSIQIVDMEGNTLFTQSVREERHIHWKVDNLRKGIYLVRGVADGKTVTKRLSVDR